jgi:phage shock protein C
MTNNLLNDAADKVKLLRRSRDDVWLGGVCNGAAKTLGVDVALMRLGLIAATLLSFGTGVVLYIACWILIPKETSAPDVYQPQDTTPTF